MPKHHNGKVHGKQNKKMMRQKELTRDVAYPKRSSPDRYSGKGGIRNTSFGSPWDKFSGNWANTGPDKEDWW